MMTFAACSKTEAARKDERSSLCDGYCFVVFQLIARIPHMNLGIKPMPKPIAVPKMLSAENTTIGELHVVCSAGLLFRT